MKIYKCLFPLILLISAFSVNAEEALSESAAMGKAQFAVCLSCHNASLNPAKAPPMFGIQRRYQRQFVSQASFVDGVSSFVKAPTEGAALMKGPIRKLGLMPALPLGDEMLKNIANYIYEADFEPPCDHWEKALSSGGGHKGQKGHQRQVKNNYNKFCN